MTCDYCDKDFVFKTNDRDGREVKLCVYHLVHASLTIFIVTSNKGISDTDASEQAIEYMLKMVDPERFRVKTPKSEILPVLNNNKTYIN